MKVVTRAGVDSTAFSFRENGMARLTVISRANRRQRKRLAKRRALALQMDAPLPERHFRNGRKGDAYKEVKWRRRY